MRASSTGATVIENARIFTGTGEVLDRGYLAVEAGRITSVGKGAAPAGLPGERLDAGGRWAMPGLIDAHCHLCLDGDPRKHEEGPLEPFMSGMLGAANARKKLMAGVTTIRDLGAPAGQNLLLRRAIEGGLVDGPRMVCAGSYICPEGGHGYRWARLAETAEEAATAAAEQLEAGADLVKVMVSGGVALASEDPDRLFLQREPISAVVEVAHRTGAPVAVHTHPAAAMRLALECGCDTIEHGTNMEPDVIEMLLERDVPVIPTMSVYDRMRRNVDGIGEELAALVSRVWEAKLPRLRAALEAGVRIGVGTDSCTFFPAGDLATELGLLVREIGMTPEQVLTAATRVNAEILRIGDQVGTLEAGKSADILLVDGEPFRNIDDMRRLSLIVARGRVYSPRG